MRSTRWTLATVGGYVLGGVVFHSPGASGVGASLYDWDPVAAVFGAILGGIVGVITGVLQSVALGGRSWRLIAASVVAVAVAHALADGAPAIWGVGLGRRCERTLRRGGPRVGPANSRLALDHRERARMVGGLVAGSRHRSGARAQRRLNAGRVGHGARHDRGDPRARVGRRDIA